MNMGIEEGLVPLGLSTLLHRLGPSLTLITKTEVVKMQRLDYTAQASLNMISNEHPRMNYGRIRVLEDV